MSDMLALSPRSRGRLAIALLAGLTLGLSACDRDESAGAALRQAQAEIEAIMPGREQLAGERLTSTYNKVLSSLGPVASGGTQSQQAAAAAIMAQAQAGLAEQPASAALEAERAARDSMASLRSAHSQYLTYSAMAEAQAAYDPTAELAEIDRQNRERDQELATLQQKKADLDAQIRELNSRVQALSGQASAKRAQSSTIRGQVANETATRGEELMTQVRELSRQADALDVQAAALEAQAQKQLTPVSEQTSLDIERVQQQKALLAQAREGVNARTQRSREQAAQGRAAAAEVAAEIRALVGEIEALREGDLARHSDEAARGFEQAATTAAQASRGGQNSGQAAVGAHRQSLGDVYWTRANGLTQWATSLEMLAGGSPALPDAAAYKAKADAARAAAKEFLDQATAAYEAANEAYQSAGGGSDVQQRIDSLNLRLSEAVKITSGGAKDIRTAAAPVDMGGEPGMGDADGAEGGASADRSTPQGTLLALKNAGEQGNFDQFESFFVTTTPEDAQAVQALGTIARGGKRLEQALIAKFGPEGEEALKAMSQQGGGMQMGDFGDMDPASVAFEIEGEVATAPLPDGQTMTMRQIDGQWKIDLGSMGADPAMLPMLSAMAPAMAQSMEEMAAEVEAGKYGSIQEAMAVMMQKMTEAAMKAMGQGGR